MIVFEHNIEYLLAFISAIFGLSIPIMLQVIERVDQRYGSTRLAERLKRENVIRACIITLIIALFTCTYAVFCRWQSLWDLWLLNNSANIIALLSCVGLIVLFLYSCSVILIYYNPEKLQNRILSEYGRAKTDQEKEKNFLDWVDLTKVILQTSDREPAFKVYDVIGKEIRHAFDNARVEGDMFPSYVVRGIISINENLCLMQRRPFSVNNGNQILKDLISQPTKLNDDAYRLLWKNLQLQLFYGQEDWVYEYWSAAVQTYDFDLAEKYDDENRKADRRRFLEFHILLCANILREKRYDLLEKITDYMRVWPPEYSMVPSTLDEILSAFTIVEESPRIDIGVEGYYPMSGMKGIVEGIVLGSAKRYLTFLYVRMFSNIGKVENTFVSYPKHLKGLKHLNEDINYMKRMLPTILNKDDLMRLLSFENRTRAEDKMKQVLEDVHSQIKVKQKEARENLPHDIDIVKENLNDAKELVEGRLKDYKSFEKEPIENADMTYYLVGNNSYLYPNSAFYKDSDISYVDMAEHVAGASIQRIQHGFASVFYIKEQKQIKINSEYIFKALDQLGIGAEYAIVSFNVYWDFYMHQNIEGLVKDANQYTYKGIPIICLHGGTTDLVAQTLFVIRKDDMPTITYIKPDESLINKYKLQTLDGHYQLYGSILQLSQDPDILDEIDIISKDEAKEQSQFNVFINAKMTWMKSVPVVSIKLMYHLSDNGTADTLKSVRSFVEMTGD